jgi:hypothetical protein
MLEVLKNTTYRHLFLAQVIALIGTGLITIALALQAYDIAKEKQPRSWVLPWRLK